MPKPSSFGFFQLTCDPPMKPDEELLILNFTRVALCVSTHALAPVHPTSHPVRELLKGFCHPSTLQTSLSQAVHTGLPRAQACAEHAQSMRRAPVEHAEPPRLFTALVGLIVVRWLCVCV